jgi:hypothetical protein
MLKELNQYENLGSPKVFCELFTQLNDAEKPWKEEHVRGYFYNRIIENVSIFDGCLPLAESIGAIIVDSNGNISLNPSLVPALINENFLTNKILSMLLGTLKNDEIFHEIFCPKNISFDIIYKRIQIDGSAFHFRYASFRRFLIAFNFLHPHPDAPIKKYIINSKYRKLFDQEIMPEIKKRKFGIDQLELLLEKNQMHGEEAENFVLEYEKKRLVAHPQANNIEIISSYDVAAGYDIASYNNMSSSEMDRFIEVKSFCSHPTFHWSRNEIDAARLRQNNYFLYLVDRDKTNSPDYKPIIIRNPYKKVLDSKQWIKRIDSYYIFKK